METIYTIIAIVIFFILSWLFHYLANSVPLTESEVIELAKHRRFYNIVEHFAFRPIIIEIDKENKKKIKPAGDFYTIMSTIENFPSFVSALLKGKKHEWLIVGLAKNKQVIGFWANKGDDNTKVSPSVGYLGLLLLIKQHEADTILLFHNHTNGILDASSVDLQSAIIDGKKYNEDGLNFLAFVVGRGNFKQYAWWVVDSLYPIVNYFNEINVLNNTHKSVNYNLNMELRRNKTKLNSSLYQQTISNIFNND